MIFGKYINKYYLKFAIFFIIGIVALVMVDVAQLFIPRFLGNIVDIFADSRLPGTSSYVISDEDQKKIVMIIILTVVFGAAMMIGRFIWRITIFHAAFKIGADLRKKMFSKAERLSVRYYHDNKVGTVMAWFTNDIEVIEDFFGWGTIMLVDAVFMSILVIVMMFMLEPILSAIALIPILLIVVWGALVEKFMSEKWEQRQQSFDALYDFSQEVFTGIGVIKAFVKETQELHAFAKRAKKDQQTNISFARISVLFDSTIEIIIALIIAIIIGFGGWFVYAGLTPGSEVVIFGHAIKLTAGQLVTFIGYFDLLVWPMIALGQIVSMRSRAKTSLKRISHFLDEPEEIIEQDGYLEPKQIKGNIEFKNFSFTYPEKTEPYIKNISLEIKEGETIGIVGKIGCGKTTLMNSLLRIYNLEKGSLFIDGVDIMDYKIKSLRNFIAYVPQDNFLFSDTVANNISFSDENMPLDIIEKGAEFSDVATDIAGFKNKYQTVSGERGATLSGGQKQRISIARAYVKHAPIMILDDSVSAVDVNTEETILKNIAERRKGQTTIVVASRVSTVNHLDKIIVLNDGELEAFASPKELMKISPTYQKMVLLQELEKEVEGGK